MQNFVSVLGILYCAFGVAACSVPNLESQNCIEARGVVKQLYSLHFAGDMRPSAESLISQKPFLTNELYSSLAQNAGGDRDYFTSSAQPPTTFKVGKCVDKDSGNADLQVQLYWRQTNATDQKDVYVQVVKTGDKWLVNRVSN